MAYLGGYLQLPEELFLWLLLLCLCLVALRIYVRVDSPVQFRVGRVARLSISALVGVLLGLLAGIVGFGGGILLVPLIIILGLGNERQAAACGAIFIWLNSLSGLVSRLQFHAVSWLDFMPIYLAVMIGGVMGSFMGSTRLSAGAMERVLGAVVVVAIAFLLSRLAVF
jgi:uncharacterized membrane protein YfcA